MPVTLQKEFRQYTIGIQLEVFVKQNGAAVALCPKSTLINHVWSGSSIWNYSRIKININNNYKELKKKNDLLKKKLTMWPLFC
jgi:hypothetical protein